MARGSKSSLVAVCACLAALLLLLAPAGASAADAPAVEQYVNTLPGVPGVDINETDPIVARSQRVGPVGVVGEQDGATPLLSSVGSAVATPAGIVLVAILAGGLALGLSRRPSRR